MNLKIKDIIKCTKGNLLIGNLDNECENFSKDTRDIHNGDTYIGIKGQNFDGSAFWEKALENGADTVIINNIKLENEKLEKYKNLNKNIIQVENTKEALKQIATAKRNLYKDLIVIGVTGSVGKTSTKDIIANVVSQKYNTLKTEGNNNNDIGLPFTILKLREHQVAIIEMGMNHFGEISELTKIAKPTISIITNIGTSHIGNLGSRENILKAKLEILEGMEEPKIIINNDNDLLHDWYKRNKENIEIHTFGINNNSDCMASDIKEEENSSEFTCDLNSNKFQENVPVGGEVFVLNSLCATMVGNLIGLSNEEIQRGISSFELTKKRMEIIKLKNGATIINDSYNASFESMKASIEYLANTKSERKIAVLGDMFELGDFSEKLHREVGKEVAKHKIDKLFIIGESSKYIGEEASHEGMNEKNIYYVSTQEELIKKLESEIIDGDEVLFKASNGMHLFDIVEVLKEVFV